MTERYSVGDGELNHSGARPDFSGVYEENREIIYRYFLRRIPQPELAADLTHDVFLSAFKAWNTFIDRGEKIPTWLTKIARGKLVDHFRKGGIAGRGLFVDVNPSEISIASKEPGPEEVVIERETLEMVRDALKDLTVDQRNAIRLRFIEDRPSVEAARILDKNPASFRGTQFRAIGAIRRNLGVGVQQAEV